MIGVCAGAVAGEFHDDRRAACLRMSQRLDHQEGVFATGLLHLDRREATGERGVGLDAARVLLARGRADDQELTAGYRQLELALELLAAVATALAGLVAIAALMAWLRRRSFTPFVVYRVLVGGSLLALIYLQAPLR